MGRLITHIKRFLREPLIHFLAIGGLLYVLYAAVSAPAPAPRDRIVVEPQRITQLTNRFEATRGRLPTEDELLGLVEGFIREEVYYREALALGLDGDDAIIRRRMQQKLEFLTDSGADLLEPAPGELEAYYQANQRSYRTPPAVAFEQVFLGETPSAESVATVLAKLRSEPGIDTSALGERLYLPERMTLSEPNAVDRQFGAGFFAALERAPVGEWTGPVQSGFGVHLARVSEALPAGDRPLDEVRETVLLDWRALKANELRDAVYTRLRGRYEIVFPDSSTSSVN